MRIAVRFHLPAGSETGLVQSQDLRHAVMLVAGILALLTLWVCVVLCAPVVAWAGGCPNEALRSELNSSQLPECRAYELVSPPLKNGWNAAVTSADGSRVLLESFGSFVGSRQILPSSFYDVGREEGVGWLTAPVVESSELENDSLRSLLAVNTGLTEGLFEDRPLSSPFLDERNIYAQVLPGDRPVEVGPIFSRPVLERYVGRVLDSASSSSASGSLKHVVFEIPGASPASRSGTEASELWPGDTTVDNTGPANSEQGFVSLYEYDGREQASPTLVGVDNEGKLISQCGVALGYPLGGEFSARRSPDVYNVVSESSSGVARVFFTAASAVEGPSGDLHHCTGSGSGEGPPADELFAREAVPSGDGVERHTIGISVPSREDCFSCDVTEVSKAVFQGASADGSKVVFLSDEQLLPSAEGENLYEYNFDGAPGGRVVLVAANMGEEQGANLQGVVRLSEDGSHLYFVSKSRIAHVVRGGDCSSDLSLAELEAEKEVAAEEEVGIAVGEGARCRPKLGENNLYLYDTKTGKTAFVGTLSPVDSKIWQQEDERPADATPDGRVLVFSSSADLTVGDTSGVAQVFEYDAQTEALTRISVGQDGFNDNGNTSQYPARIAAQFYSETEDPAPQLSSVSDDGSMVVFESDDALTPQALEGFPNVYEYHGGVVSLISDGQDRSSTGLAGVDGSGQDIFFLTADALVPQDGDTQRDVYDARVDGGFAPSSGRAECEGEACQGSPSPVPVFGAPASVTVAGESAPTTARGSSSARVAPVVKAKPKSKKCPKSDVRRGGRCIRKPKPKARKAVTDRRHTR